MQVQAEIHPPKVNQELELENLITAIEDEGWESWEGDDEMEDSQNTVPTVSFALGNPLKRPRKKKLYLRKKREKKGCKYTLGRPEPTDPSSYTSISDSDIDWSTDEESDSDSGYLRLESKRMRYQTWPEKYLGSRKKQKERRRPKRRATSEAGSEERSSLFPVIPNPPEAPPNYRRTYSF